MLGSARSALLKKSISGTFPDPIAAYGFSEGSGTTSADATGNGYTLTLNGTTFAAGGHSGYGLTNVDATTGAAAAVVAPPNFTIMGWVKALDLTAGSSHFAFGILANSGNTHAGIFLQRDDFGTLNVPQGYIRTGALYLLEGASQLTANVWIHLALTYDGSTGIMYKDASVIATDGSITGSASPGDALYIAGRAPAVLSDTDVIVDDVRVFDVALTSAEISAAMATSVT